MEKNDKYQVCVCTVKFYLFCSGSLSFGSGSLTVGSRRLSGWVGDIGKSGRWVSQAGKLVRKLGQVGLVWQNLIQHH